MDCTPDGFSDICSENGSLFRIPSHLFLGEIKLSVNPVKCRKNTWAAWDNLFANAVGCFLSC